MAPLQKFPPTLSALLCSSDILKIGRNVAADISKIRRDWSDCKLPDKVTSIVEIGDLANLKGVVSKRNASLASIVAATLKCNLLKEM